MRTQGFSQAGTIFEETIGFLVSHDMVDNETGKRRKCFGAASGSWTWLHTKACNGPARHDLLPGTIQVDEIYVGGEKAGGSGTAGKV